MRIFSSAEYFRRVLRLISLTCFSADPFGPCFYLIIFPFLGKDEPNTLVANQLICLMVADGKQILIFLCLHGLHVQPTKKKAAAMMRLGGGAIATSIQLLRTRKQIEDIGHQLFLGAVF